MNMGVRLLLVLLFFRFVFDRYACTRVAQSLSNCKVQIEKKSLSGERERKRPKSLYMPSTKRNIGGKKDG
jgi:hypothetical protein